MAERNDQDNKNTEDDDNDSDDEDEDEEVAEITPNLTESEQVKVTPNLTESEQVKVTPNLTESELVEVTPNLTESKQNEVTPKANKLEQVESITSKPSTESVKSTHQAPEAGEDLTPTTDDAEGGTGQPGKAMEFLQKAQAHLFCLDLCLGPFPEEKVVRPKFNLMDIVFIFFNLCIIAIGVALISFSGMILHMRSLNAVTGLFDSTGRLSNLKFGNLLDNFAFGMIPVGVVFVATGAFGCFGTILFHRRMLSLYRNVMIAVVLLQIIGVLYAIIARGSIGGRLQKTMLTHVRDSYEGTVNSTRFVSQVMDVAQVFFSCCGVNSWKDFEQSPWYKIVNNISDTTLSPNFTAVNDSSSSNTTVINLSNTTAKNLVLFPLTCCKADLQLLSLSGDKDSLSLSNPNCQTDPPGRKNPFTGISCSQGLKNWMWSNLIVVISIVITVLSMEASLISNSHDMMKAIKKLQLKKEKAKKKLVDDDALSRVTAASSAKSVKNEGVLNPKKKETDVDTGSNFSTPSLGVKSSVFV